MEWLILALVVGAAAIWWRGRHARRADGAGCSGRGPGNPSNPNDQLK